MAEDRLLMQEALEFSKIVKKRFNDDQPIIYTNFFKIMERFNRRRIGAATVASHVKNLFRGHNDLILGFNKFLPKQHANTVCEDGVESSLNVKVRGESSKKVDSRKRSSVEFVFRVRRCLNNDEKFKKYIAIMANYMKHKNVNQVKQEASTLFEANPELSEEFATFLTDVSTLRSPTWKPEFIQKVSFTTKDGAKENTNKGKDDVKSSSTGKIRKGSSEKINPNKKSAIEFMIRVKRSLNNDEMYKKFCDVMASYIKHKDANRVDQEAAALFKPNPELYKEFMTFLANVTTLSSHGKQKVNKRVPSITKAKFQEKMNRCEDDMFEKDMLFHRYESAKDAMERLHEACEKEPTDEIDIEDYLSSINLRCIERLYHDDGPYALDRLREDPRAVSSAILIHLKQKYEKLKEERTQINRKTAETRKNLSRYRII